MTQQVNEGSNIIALRNSLQKLSFDQLLDELGKMKLKLKLSVIIPIIFERGREKSLTDLQIREIIKARIDIPESTYRRYLPEGAKVHKYPKRNRSLNLSENDGKKSVKENTSRMSVNTELNSGSATNNSAKPILGRVYRDWTLEQLISRYEDIETKNEILSQQLADANLRIEELEQLEERLLQEGILTYD